MKICYVSSSYLPSTDANSIHVMKMCQSLAKNGHQVTLIGKKGSLKNTDLYDYYGVTHSFNIIAITPLRFKYLGTLVYALKAYCQIKKQNADLVYGRSLYALVLAIHLGIPVIFESHAPPNSLIQKWAEKILTKKKNFRHLVLISEALKKIYQSNSASFTPKIVVAHDGADLVPHVHPNTAIKSSNKLKVGYIGSLYQGRGIEIITQLADSLPFIDFHVIGGPDPIAQEYKHTYSSQVNLHFHGFLAPKDISGFCHTFDILVAPYQEKVAVSGNTGDTSKWMSPLKIFEYMSFKKPIVCSDFPVLREVLVDGVNCLLVQANNKEAWKEAILKLKNDDLRNKLADSAYKTLCDHYLWDIRAVKVLNEEAL